MQELEEQFKANGGTFEEYRIGDLFEKQTLRFLKSKFDKIQDVSKVKTSEFNVPLVNAKDGDNGIMYYGRETDFETEEMCIDIVNDGAVSTGNVYPQPQRTGVLYNAYLVKPYFDVNDELLIYCAQALQKAIKLKFGYDKKASWERVQNEYFSLPTLNGEIAFDYMESYICELQNESIIKLNAYLKSSGLENTELTQEEKNAVLKLRNGDVKWNEFKVGELFESSNGDFDIQKTHINNKGDYVITAGLTDNGILGKSDIKARVFDSHTITVDMFGFAFYRNFKYKIVTHARVFSLKPKIDINDESGFFIVTTFKYLTQLFGYGNMCSWEKIKNYTICFPITADGAIDWDFMQNLITAESRLAIRGVVEWKDKILDNF